MNKTDLQNIKFNRLSIPERIILNTFKDLMVSVEHYYQNKVPVIVFKSIDGTVIYEYFNKTKRLYYHFLLDNQLNQYFDDTHDSMNLVKIMLSKKFNLEIKYAIVNL